MTHSCAAARVLVAVQHGSGLKTLPTGMLLHAALGAQQCQTEHQAWGDLSAAGRRLHLSYWTQCRSPSCSTACCLTGCARLSQAGSVYLVAAGGQLHPAPAHNVAVHHESQGEQHVALIRDEGAVRAQPGQGDAVLQHACTKAPVGGQATLLYVFQRLASVRAIADATWGVKTAAMYATTATVPGEQR